MGNTIMSTRKSKAYEKYIRNTPSNFSYSYLWELQDCLEEISEFNETTVDFLYKDLSCYSLFSRLELWKPRSIVEFYISSNGRTFEEDEEFYENNEYAVKFSGRIKVLNDRICEVIIRRRMKTRGNSIISIFRSWCLIEHCEEFLIAEIRKIKLAMCIFEDNE